jgi:excinuclease ABC subunit B
MASFQLHAPYAPKGDQPTAIAALTAGVESGERYQTLLGATGTGKTFSIANVIAQTGRPTLVLAHNKTLAAQLCNELREFFPNNAVEYFISYYDYYQPEAYVPVSDTYIAKTASINEEIDMLRHSATRSLFERKDVIVVASISCIYGLGIPSEYLKAAVKFQVGETLDLRSSLRELVNNQYSRNDIEIARGRFRVRGDVLEIGPAYEDRLVRIELFGDEVEAIRYVDPTSGEILQSLDTINIYPAKHFVTPKERLEGAIKEIRAELRERLDLLNLQGRLLEAQRLEQRTTYDLEMLEQVGYCNGVENYARHLAGRPAGTPPVNSTPSTPSCATSNSAGARAPCSRLITPAGSPASCHSRNVNSATSGVCSDGLKITVLPAISAGMICPFGRWPGKLNGPSTAITPCG